MFNQENNTRRKKNIVIFIAFFLSLLFLYLIIDYKEKQGLLKMSLENKELLLKLREKDVLIVSKSMCSNDTVYRERKIYLHSPEGAIKKQITKNEIKINKPDSVAPVVRTIVSSSKFARLLEGN